MANSTKKTKQSTFLNLGENNQIFEHMENNPGDSFQTIAKIFSEKFNKPIQRALVFRACNRIKSEKSNGLQINDSQKCIHRLYSAAYLNFWMKTVGLGMLELFFFNVIYQNKL